MNKQYIGDSVYVEDNGYGVTLTTNKGHQDDPRNVIILEPEVIQGLLGYIERMKEHYKENN